MRYQEACDHLMKGEYVSRDKWDSECGYLVDLSGLIHFLKVITQPESKVQPWAAVKEDSLADDWKVVTPNNDVRPDELQPAEGCSG